MPPKMPAAPYQGAAYYPECWPVEQMDEDIRLMKDAGMTVMRMAEFAWYTMEPEEGKYDFAWLHNAVDKLAENGIWSILCTPTCTPPRWLTLKYPDLVQQDAFGNPMPHGARRHYCPNHPIYREYSRKITEKLAEEFGDDPNVIGWQIDNEFSVVRAHGCCCPVCQEKFKAKMEEKYGNIDALNEAWGLTIWSQWYPSFDSLSLPPRPDLWNHPSLLRAWSRFQAESCAEYCHIQSKALHARVGKHQPVGTDMTPFPDMNHPNMHADLDIAMINHYITPDDFWKTAFWMDYVRSLKPGVPFWNTETSNAWTGGAVCSDTHPDGLCTANAWLPIINGGEANLFWLWRAHRNSHELMFSGIVSSSGRPVHSIHEIRNIGAGYEKAGDFVRNTKPEKAPVAMHFSLDAWSMFNTQPISTGFDYRVGMNEGTYQPLTGHGIRTDVIDPRMPMEDYTIVFTPFQPWLNENGLSQRLKDWIEAGGTWVLGPLTDIRDEHGGKLFAGGQMFSVVEDWAKVYVPYEYPVKPELTITMDGDTKEWATQYWHLALEPKDGAKAIAHYTDGPLKGYAAATVTPMGKGQVVFLGTIPEGDALANLFVGLMKEKGMAPLQQSSNLCVVPRTGESQKGIAAVELYGKEGWLELPFPVTDVLTGASLKGRIQIPPYGVFIGKA